MNSIEEDNAVERRAKGADQLGELRGGSKLLRQPEPIAAWDSLVERKIREAQKQGLFELERLRQGLAGSKRWYDGAIAALEGKTGPQAEEERAWVEAYWERRLSSLVPRVDELNEKIELFNLKVPIANLQRRRVPIKEELQRLSSE